MRSYCKEIYGSEMNAVLTNIIFRVVVERSITALGCVHYCGITTSVTVFSKKDPLLV